MSQSRSSLLAAAFRETTLEIGGLTFRPPTAGSIDLLQQIKNPLFSEAGEDCEPGGELLPLFEFIWIHTAPLDDVLAAAEKSGAIRIHARRLAFLTPLENIQRFADSFQGFQSRLSAAMSEAIPEDGDEGKPVTSPTGSPCSSSPLAGQGTRTASDSSSGISLSPGLSSISTPPADTMEPPADGASISTKEPTPTPLPTLLVSPDDGS